MHLFITRCIHKCCWAPTALTTVCGDIFPHQTHELTRTVHVHGDEASTLLRLFSQGLSEYSKNPKSGLSFHLQSQVKAQNRDARALYSEVRRHNRKIYRLKKQTILKDRNCMGEQLLDTIIDLLSQRIKIALEPTTRRIAFASFANCIVNILVNIIVLFTTDSTFIPLAMIATNITTLVYTLVSLGIFADEVNTLKERMVSAVSTVIETMRQEHIVCDKELPFSPLHEHNTAGKDLKQVIAGGVGALITVLMISFGLSNIANPSTLKTFLPIMSAAVLTGTAGYKITDWIVSICALGNKANDDAISMELASFHDESSRLATDPICDILGDPLRIQEILSYMDRRTKLFERIKKDCDINSHPIVMAILSFSKNITDRIVAVKTIPHKTVRQVPIAALFHGRKGCGKTIFAQKILMPELAKKLEYKNDLVYYIDDNKEQKYWTRFGNEPFAYVDDAFRSKDSIMANRIHNMISHAPQIAQGAAVEEKEQLFRAGALIMTTNSSVENIDPNLKFSSDESKLAFWDRIMVIRVERESSPRMSNYLDEPSAVSKDGYKFFLEMVNPRDVPRTIDVCEMTLDQCVDFLALKLKNTEIEYCIESLAMFDKYGDRCSAELKAAAITQQTARLEFLRTLNFNKPNIQIPDTNAVPRTKFTKQSKDKNRHGHFNPCVVRIQGPPGTCKTRIITDTVTKLAILTNYQVFEVKRKFAPSVSKAPQIYVYDDIIEESTYSAYLDFINSCHSRSIHIIGSNTVFEKTHRPFYSRWAKSSPSYTQFELEPRHEGLVRRIGIPGEVYNYSIKTAVPHNLALCFTTVSGTEALSYADDSKLPIVQIPNHIIKFFSNYLREFSEFEWVQTLPTLPEEFDFSLVTQTEDDLQKLLSKFSNLQQCFLGNRKLGEMHVSASVIANRSMMNFSNFVIRTENLSDIYETMTLFVREVRKAKSDATICIKANGKSVIVIGNVFYTNFDVKKVVTEISDLDDDGSFTFKFGEDELTMTKQQLDDTLKGNILQFDDYDPLIAIALELKVAKLQPKLAAYVEEHSARHSKARTLAQRILDFANSTLGRVIIGFIGVLLMIVGVTKLYNYFTRDYSKVFDRNSRWDPKGPLSQPQYDKNAIIRDQVEEYLDTGRYSGDIPFEDAHDTYTRMTRGRYESEYNCNNQSAHGAYLRSLCIVRSNIGCYLFGSLIGKRYLICPDHIRDGATKFTAQTEGKMYDLTFLYKIKTKDMAVFELPIQFSNRKPLSWVFKSQHDDLGLVGKATCYTKGTIDFTQETGTIHPNKTSTANPVELDRTEKRIGLVCNLSNHSSTFYEGLCGLPLVVKTRDGERVGGMFTSMTNAMLLYTPLTSEIINSVLSGSADSNKSGGEKKILIDQFLSNRIRTAELNMKNPEHRIIDPETDVKVVGYLHPKKFRHNVKDRKVFLAAPEKALSLPFAPSVSQYDQVIDKSKLPTIHNGLGKQIPVDLVYNQVRQYGIHENAYNPDEKMMLKACVYMRDVYDQQYDRMRFLSISEAINGFYQPTSPYFGLLSPIAMDKSAGWRHKNLGKGIYIKGDCYKNVAPPGRPTHYVFNDTIHGQDLKERVSFILRSLADGRVVQSCAEACPKDEILPKEKVAIGKIRAFIIPDHEMIVVSRILFGMLHSNMIKHREQGGCQMGMDPIIEFDRIYRSIAKFEDKGENMDISRQDKHIRFIQRRRLARIISHLSWDLKGSEELFGREITPEDVTTILDTFILTMKELVIHLPTGHIVLVGDSGVFSGEFMTTGFDSADVDLNDIYTMLRYFDEVKKQPPPPPRLYRELVNEFIYGDDNKRNSDVAAIPPDFRKRCYAEVGQVIVPIDKNDEGLNDPFLSREPIEIEGKIIGRLKKSSLERPLYYSNTLDADVVTQAWLCVLSEACLYEEDYFNYIRSEMKQICAYRYPNFIQAEKQIFSLSYRSLRQTLIHISQQGRGRETDIYMQSNLINLISSFSQLKTDYSKQLCDTKSIGDFNCSSLKKKIVFPTMAGNAPVSNHTDSPFFTLNIRPYDFKIYGSGGLPAYTLPYQDANSTIIIQHLMLNKASFEVGFFTFGPSNDSNNQVKVRFTTAAGDVLLGISETFSNKKVAARDAYEHIASYLEPLGEDEADFLRERGWLPGTLAFTDFLKSDHQEYLAWREPTIETPTPPDTTALVELLTDQEQWADLSRLAHALEMKQDWIVHHLCKKHFPNKIFQSGKGLLGDKNCAAQMTPGSGMSGMGGDHPTAMPVLNKPALGGSAGGGQPEAPMQAGQHTAAMEPQAPAMPMVNNQTDTQFDSYQVQTMLPGFMANLGGMNKNTISLVEACGLPLETGTFVISSNDIQGKVLRVFEYSDTNLLHPYAQLYALSHENFYGDVAVTMDMNGPPLQQGSIAFFYTNNVTPYLNLQNVAEHFAELQLVYWRQISLANQQAITFIISDARQNAFFRDRSNTVAVPQRPGIICAVYQPLQNQFSTDNIFQVYVHMRGRFALAGETENPYTVFQPVSMPRIKAAIQALKGGQGPDPLEPLELRSFLKINNSEPYYLATDGIGNYHGDTSSDSYLASPFRLPSCVGIAGAIGNPLGAKMIYAPVFTNWANGSGVLLTHYLFATPTYPASTDLVNPRDLASVFQPDGDFFGLYISQVDYQVDPSNMFSAGLDVPNDRITFEFVIVGSTGTTIARLFSAFTDPSGGPIRYAYGTRGQTDTPVTADASDPLFQAPPTNGTLPTGQARVCFSKCPPPLVQPTYRSQCAYASDTEITRGFDDKFYDMGGIADNEALDITVATSTNLSVAVLRYLPKSKTVVTNVGPTASAYFTFVGDFDDLIVVDVKLVPANSSLQLFSSDLFTSRSVGPFGMVRRAGGDRENEPSSSAIKQHLVRYEWNCGNLLAGPIGATFLGSQPGAAGEIGKTMYEQYNKEQDRGFANYMQQQQFTHNMDRDRQFNQAAKDLLNTSIMGQSSMSLQNFEQAKMMRGIMGNASSYRMNYRGRGGIQPIQAHSGTSTLPHVGPGHVNVGAGDAHIVGPPQSKLPPLQISNNSHEMKPFFSSSQAPGNYSNTITQTSQSGPSKFITRFGPPPMRYASKGDGSDPPPPKVNPPPKEKTRYRLPGSVRNETKGFSANLLSPSDVGHRPQLQSTAEVC